MNKRMASRRLDPRIARRLAGAGRGWEVRHQNDKKALLEERTRLLAALDNPGPETDLAAVSKRAGEVADALDQIKAAEETRARLAGHAAGAEERGGDDTPEARGIRGGSGAGDGEDGGERRDRAPQAEVRIGEVFVQSDAYKDMEARAFNGNASVQIPGEVRALIDSALFAGQATRVPGVVAPKERPVRLLDLIDRQSLGTAEVEYVVELTYSDNPDVVAEGALKPEASMTGGLETAKAVTIANWVNITRQAAADNRQVMGYVQGRLSRGLLRKVESQVLNGSGVGGQMEGLLVVTGTGTYAAPAGEKRLISVRKAKTVAQLSEYEPDAVVLNPTEWESIELDTDNNGQFRVTPNVQGSISQTLWGLNVVVTTVIAAGSFLVGSMLEGATLWEREGLNVLMTDSHASNFTANILTLLVEGRWALAVWRPAAFVKGTFATA